MKTYLKRIIFLAAMASLLLSCNLPASLTRLCSAETLLVTKTEDTNDGLCTARDCSLREAVVTSNSCPETQTIQIPAGTYRLTQTGADEEAARTGDLDLLDSVNLEGDGNPVIDGNATDRIFEVKPGIAVFLSGFVLQNGQTPLFGSAIANQGNLTVDRVLLQNNRQTEPSGTGGAIFSYDLGSSLDLSNSAVVNNWAASGAAGLYNVAGTMTLTNVTLSGNRGYAVTNLQGGQTRIQFSTLANDFGTYEIWNPGVGGAVVVSNSILAGRTAEGNCFQPVTSDGYNLDSALGGTANTCGLASPSDLIHTDPRLLPLADNGGGLPTLGLDPASPAINSADPVFCSGVDQRGVARPQGTNCDRGAFELENPPVLPTLTPTPANTHEPEMTPTPLPARTIQATVTLTVNANANCRKGPGLSYFWVTAFAKGTAVEIKGQNKERTWVLVQIPASEDTCWTYLALGEASDPWFGVPVVATPLLPETPDSFLDTSTCTADGHTVKLTWSRSPHATGYNLYRGEKLLATPNAGSRSYEDYPPREKSYYYYLEAINAFGVSERLETTVLACP